MSTKLTKFVAMLIVAGLLLVPISAIAAGTGPADAMPPSDDWVPLGIGESHWYAFDYRGHHEFEAAEEEEEEEAIWVSSSVQVLLDAEPDQGAAFKVYTEDQIRAWTQGEDLEAVGQGTENEYTPGDLCWCGDFAEAGRYYVVVEQQGPEPSFYKLTINGEDISFPAAPAPTGAEPVSEPVLASEAIEPAAMAGTGPASAMAPGADWVTLDVGDAHWYAFDYQGHHEFETAEDEDEEDEAIWISTNVQVLLDAEPDASVTFKIYTDRQIRAWTQGEDLEAVGQGTENEYAPGDLCWCGNFGGPGRYYVVVEQRGPESGVYKLTINGEDISL
jgi:hypothetical protein